MDNSADSKREPGSGPDTERSILSRRWLWILFALVVLGAVLTYLDSAEDTIDVGRIEAATPAQMVSIETVEIGPETAEIRTFAEVRARWTAEIRAAVSGRIMDVRESALAGEHVSEGATLIKIEDTQYVAGIATAELALAEARLGLLRAENDATVARKQFERDGTAAPNDLALKLPQLRIAERAVTSAEAQVAAAKRQLADTTIAAPFSGIVTERFASLGQSVSAGERLLMLVDDTRFDLTVELGKNDWALLQQPLSGSTARVLDQEGELVSEARIRQGGGFLDEASRQYRVFLEIADAQSTPVLSGDFVRVALPGRDVSKALNIPETALTREGFVWHLDNDDRLQRFDPEILFRRHDRIVIEAPEGASTWRIATTPLASFLPGQQARALDVGG
ncbi:MAG: efflux RND transporter periplasmic adaptor subunit [Pseudomonadota bacterium]